MKKNSSSLRLCVLLCATFFLTACMGGGSGGGGAGSGGGISFPGPITQGDGIASMITLEEIADAPRIAQLGEAFGQTVAGKTIPEMWLPTAGLANSAPLNNINGFRDYFDFGQFGFRPPNSLYVHLEPGSNIFCVYNKNENFWLDISPEFFTVFDNGLIGAITSDISVKRNGNLWSATFYNGVGGITQRQEDLIGDAYETMKASGATGEMRLFETIMLAGHPVGLEYTNFGFWEARFMADGIIDGQSVNSAISSYVPFMLVAANAVVEQAPNDGAFNGLVVANAYDRSDDLNSKSVSLTGTASLNVISATVGDISFDFNNFYKLSTDLNISGSDGITQSGAFVVTPQGTNSTGINLAGGGTGLVTGQFYGGLTATEAVGTFGYSEGLVGVRGAFGGVKVP